MSSTTKEKPLAQEAKPRVVTSVGDRVFAGLTLGASLIILLALASVFIFLLVKGLPGFTKAADVYGPRASSFFGYVSPLLGGTLIAAVIALIIAVPLAWGIALVISHYAPRFIAVPVAYLVDLLAAVPSVVFGLWGVIVLAPQMVPVFEFLNTYLGFIPIFGGDDDVVSKSGRTILTAGVVLAIMILPIITAITREVFSRTPRLNQEAALALGATRWEMMRLTVFPYGRSGMVSATMLGLGRALGETMAVAMVLSLGGWNVNLLGPGNSSIAANIASKYKERSEDLLSVLIATGLVLFLLTFLVNFTARWIVGRSERKMASA
ncbi:phosphate ABC transporter permease subunit PstC [Nocardioides sp.]|uniref:phosphate ABC transporter permease subunit PstC n=1 Tax=Nocardioides sp. TaxID=35761 RepID=UPI00271B4230|nr:phosphate ABC transporter permease subunit PstC [Nocardioides sp.]MDO9454987.1 phosphate ABC transporter permease subunit PstC [Nocardioides sp.]